MIRVTVELISARTGEISHLGTAIITNDGTRSVESKGTRGDYLVTLSQRGRPETLWRKGWVRDFPRQRLGAFDLLYRALRATVGDRNP